MSRVKGAWLQGLQRSTKARVSISPNTQGRGEETLNGGLTTQVELESSTFCRGSPTLGFLGVDPSAKLVVYVIGSRMIALHGS